MEARLSGVSARAYTIPTDAPEADGTAQWHETTIVVVTVTAGGMDGLDYTYADAMAAELVRGKLAEVVEGLDAMDLPRRAWAAMRRAVRNLGRPGLAATAISTVDVALWDPKARLLDVPLAVLLGRHRDEVPVYGSGGFTSYNDVTLTRQLVGWVERDGCRRVKMKVGTGPERDPARVRAALPAPMDVAAGECAWEPGDVRRTLAAGAVDVQQANATRCGGVTGFVHAASLCGAFHTDLSAHCAPALHRQLGCAAARFRHLEWFHDHVHIEGMLFDGAPVPRDGRIAPDWQRLGLGLGLILKRQDAERFGAGAG